MTGTFSACFRRAWPLLAVPGVTGLIYFPYLLSGFPLGADQDLFLIFYEAFRQSVVTFREFPFWNPWCHGGVPLFANPQIAVFGWEGLCVLLFGTWKGLHLAMFLQFLTGGAGMYLFLEKEERAARIFGSLAFVLAGGISAHLMEGHVIASSFLHVPLFLYFVRHLPDSFGMALTTGVMAALLTNSCLHYFTIVAFVMGGMLFLRYAAGHWKEKKLYLHLLAAFLAWMAAGGIRLLVTLEYLFHFPRILTQPVLFPPLNILKAFAVPFVPLQSYAGGGPLYGWAWHEITCYTGVVLLFFFVLSMIRRPGWKHFAALLFFALAFDNTMMVLPGYWLRKIVPFSSFFVISRWRFALLFFLIWTASEEVSDLWKNGGRRRRGLLAAALLLSLGMMAANQLYVFYGNHPILKEETFLSSVALPEFSGEIRPVFLRKGSMYGHIRKGYAVLNSYEPMLGYSRICRIPPERYQAPLFFCRNGNTELVQASPNRFRFRTRGEGIFFLNQNPGNYWTDGQGRRLFPGMRELEETRLFLADPLRTGEWEMVLRPPLFRTGCILSGISGLILTVWILYRVFFSSSRWARMARKEQRDLRG